MDEGSLTRADLVDLLGALETRLKAGMVELRTELKAETAELRTELKAETAGLKTEMVGLKTDVADLKTELQARFATKAELTAMKQEVIDAVQEQVRDSQTEVLKAFLPYQERTNVRFRGMDAKVANTEAELRARMEILEKRLEQIETKLLLEPPAA